MNLKRELPLITIVLLPFIYLGYVWNTLPAKIPVHWNMKGEVNRYGDKMELLLIVFLLPLLTYLIFLIVPKIDPKNKLNKMGNKLHNLKAAMTIIMSVLALFIIYSSKHQSLANPNFILILVGILFIVLGNYFQTIKANYFIGIRTPWTLESENVWNKTHQLAGKIWFVGGLLIVASSLILPKDTSVPILLIITAIITIIPMGYSYVLFGKEKNMNTN